MKITDCWKNYSEYTGKASDIMRQLSLGGIALIWAFKVETAGKYAIAPELLRTGFLIVLALGLDFFQYLFGSASWGIYARLKERTQKTEDDFSVPAAINWPTFLCFWGKSVSILGAYIFMLKFLIGRFTW